VVCRFEVYPCTVLGDREIAVRPGAGSVSCIVIL